MWVFRLAFPGNTNTPAHPPQLACYEPISLDVLQELCVPELESTLWRVAKLATGMSMPEAPMDQDNATPFWQYDIRFAGNCSGVKPEAITEPMEHRSHNQLWICIAAFDTGHVPAAMLL